MAKGTHDFAPDPRNETILINVNGDLVPRPEGMPAWEDLPEKERAFQARLMEVFEVDEEVALADVRGFIESLDQAGFLEAG